jgi:hypothetical protein
MKSINITIYLIFIGLILGFFSCEKEAVLVTPDASFQIYKGTSVFTHKSDTINLIESTDLTFKVKDTIVFKNQSTGERSVIFTGDTIFNTNGTISGGHVSDLIQLRILDPKTNQYVRITGNYFPKPDVDLAIEYGNPVKRKFKNDQGVYYTGIYTYQYLRPGSFKVKVYSYNYDANGVVALDSTVNHITIVP